MRENRTYGSVRGVCGDIYIYLISLNIYYNTDLIVTHQISDKYLNYKKEHAKEILKSDALKSKTEKEIEEFIEKNLSNMDMLLE